MFNRFFLILLGILFFEQSFGQKVTYYEHIAPIIQSKCAPCHRPGEAGPFSLLSYADVAKKGLFHQRCGDLWLYATMETRQSLPSVCK